MKPDVVYVKSYPVGAAARQYADVVKPVLVTVAKRLGYSVGIYKGHGLPSTLLRCTDPSSPIDCLMLYWHGRDLEVGVRSRAWRQQMRTGIGQIAHAMSFGVHEAYGRSNAADLAARIEAAITAALAEFAKEQETPR